ncbi:diaminopimelate decarboxylase [Pseudoclavibacter sp. AY1F1]|uniref:type III PLP-dependent enzyme n=1 Tax=Pseudoclavibacter sp. AY1F1 TaxID=2080583 RepID=UPI000CE7F51D|nr:type III PLP-dependent enzyme [Pseudoclavibacter sp. AY1F1]PPF42355.1 diaminopimelate decarboxylase [Pseudoclavibacter sp. AY1F1]
MPDQFTAIASAHEKVAAAERFGTPCYLYDAGEIERQYSGLRSRLDDRMQIYFSLKANPNVSIIAKLFDLGASAEVSSLVELHTALRAGVPGHRILFLGPGKSRAEIEACLEHDVRAIICESAGELDLIDQIARGLGVTADVVLRVNASFEVKGSGLTMGGKPRQFGIDEQQLFSDDAFRRERPHVRLMGVQAYMGTRILLEATIVENTRRIFELAEQIAAHLDFHLELVDVGGGLGVAYFKGEHDLDIELLAADLNEQIAAFASRRPGTEIVMELGRYLVATCGTYVTRVRYVKESLGERFAVTDGGTNHHMAAIGIGSIGKRNFPIAALRTDGDTELVPWNVTGPLCTPNDTIGKAVQLPADLAPGDLIAVERSGAYGVTASPVHFLSHGYPAEVLLEGGAAVLVRHRDAPEDLMSRQILHRFAHASSDATPITVPVAPEGAS